MIYRKLAMQWFLRRATLLSGQPRARLARIPDGTLRERCGKQQLNNLADSDTSLGHFFRQRGSSQDDSLLNPVSKDCKLTPDASAHSDFLA
jgi:hypothetical protein